MFRAAVRSVECDGDERFVLKSGAMKVLIFIRPQWSGMLDDDVYIHGRTPPFIPFSTSWTGVH